MLPPNPSKHLRAPLVLVLSTCLVPGAASAQTPPEADLDLARADSLRQAGDLPAAAEALYHAYQALPADDRGGEDGVGYRLASTLALMGGRNDRAFSVLEQILPSLTSMKVLHDPDMHFLVADERWGEVETTMLDRLATTVTGPFDRDLARSLLTMRRNEWVGRYHIMLLFRQTGGQSPVLTLLSHGMGVRHQQNEVQLMAILDRQGWPHVSAVGEEAAYAATNVLTHMGLEARRTYLPMLAAACEAGEADWGEYAASLDRTELESGRPQVYGTQMEWSDQAGSYVPQEMIEPDRVDERRAAKGMEPLADQLARFSEAMARDLGRGGRRR